MVYPVTDPLLKLFTPDHRSAAHKLGITAQKLEEEQEIRLGSQMESYHESASGSSEGICAEHYSVAENH